MTIGQPFIPDLDWAYLPLTDQSTAAHVVADETKIPGPTVSEGVKYDTGKTPVYNGFFLYFPRAIAAVANVSKFGSEKYNVPFADQNWRKVESARFRDAEGRHLLAGAAGELYAEDSKLLHAAHKAWNAMQELETLLTNGTPEKQNV